MARATKQVLISLLFVCLCTSSLPMRKHFSKLPSSLIIGHDKKLFQVRGGGSLSWRPLRMASAFFQSLLDPTFMSSSEANGLTDDSKDVDPFSRRGVSIVKRSGSITELDQVQSGRSRVKTIKDTNDFKSAIRTAGKRLVIVDFYASWCGPCKEVAPKYAELSTNHKNVVFLKVDVDRNREISSKYQVKSMPTFVFIKNGKVLSSVVGGDIEAVKSSIDQYS